MYCIVIVYRQDKAFLQKLHMLIYITRGKGGGGIHRYFQREEGRDLTQSCDRSPNTT